MNYLSKLNLSFIFFLTTLVISFLISPYDTDFTFFVTYPLFTLTSIIIVVIIYCIVLISFKIRFKYSVLLSILAGAILFNFLSPVDKRRDEAPDFITTKFEEHIKENYTNEILDFKIFNNKRPPFNFLFHTQWSASAHFKDINTGKLITPSTKFIIELKQFRVETRELSPPYISNYKGPYHLKLIENLIFFMGGSDTKSNELTPENN